MSRPRTHDHRERPEAPQPAPREYKRRRTYSWNDMYPDGFPLQTFERNRLNEYREEEGLPPLEEPRPHWMLSPPNSPPPLVKNAFDHAARDATEPTGVYCSAREKREAFLAKARAAGARAITEGRSEQQMNEQAREQALLDEINGWELARVQRFLQNVTMIERCMSPVV